jgi:hypothetical protein
MTNCDILQKSPVRTTTLNNLRIWGSGVRISSGAPPYDFARYRAISLRRVNLKAANALALAIPPPLLVLADEVIE